MCGIVGYVGNKNALSILLQGLERLEYRGYDSAGVACLTKHKPGIFVVKEKGKLSQLKKRLRNVRISTDTGIGHTRWATHGEPSKANAHPQLDSKNRIALVHNGIIENYSSLKVDLVRKGYKFRSETDTEVAVNLFSSQYNPKKGFLNAFKKSIKKMHGHFAFVALAKNEPGQILVFKRSNPIVIGIGTDESFVASDISAILPYTNKILYLKDEEYAIVKANSISIFSLKNDKEITRRPAIINWNISQARKSGYAHFMLKEMHDQPQVLEDSISNYLTANGKIHFDTLDDRAIDQLKAAKRVIFVSCGTAYHAGMIGSILIEDMLRVPSSAQVSSEFRYGNPVINRNDLVILITQSGETADTLEALRRARDKGAFVLAIVNVVGSTIAREADSVIYTYAGPEIGVASTKAYTAQVMTLIFLALYLSQLNRTLARPRFMELIEEIKKLPKQVSQILNQDKIFDRCAKKHFKRGNFLYLGRGYNFPTALEGALKLKEISYAHAHGYAAGEMKHGPIALVDNKQPVVCIAPMSKTYEKMISNVQEIKARRGIIIAIATENDNALHMISEDCFFIPKVSEVLSPILSVIPLQFFAYKIAVLNGNDVDQPRNLAKSVTVE